MSHPLSNAELLARFFKGDRLALAKIITLVESSAPGDQADKLLVLSKINGNPHSMRLAISGPPGVGKSTFINALGPLLINKGFKLAVLPIDPSSVVSFGSILGDKARMKELASREEVYIRPSPSRGILGGVSMATRDVMLVVEAFGFDAVIIETVGVGQSESLANMLCDHFVVLMQPGAGDQLQAMKKGIVELADCILVNKADGEQENMAKKTKDSLAALSLSHGAHHNKPYIGMVSALTGAGLDDFMAHLEQFSRSELAKRRQQKSQHYFKSAFIMELAEHIAHLPSIDRQCHEHMAGANNELSLTPLINKLTKSMCAKL